MSYICLCTNQQQVTAGTSGGEHVCPFRPAVALSHQHVFEFAYEPQHCDLFAGFSVAHTVNEVFVPTKVDLETGEVQSSSHDLHYFR